MTDPMKWLEGRGLSKGVLSALGVKRVDHPDLGPAVAFAYRRNGEPYAAKFRAADRKDFRSSKGISRGVYNEDGLMGHVGLPVVITEGEIDALSCIQAGWDRSISVPDGWSDKGDKLGPLVDVEDALRAAPYVVLAGDSDEAGASLPRAVAGLLNGADVRHAVWPEGCKDPNDVLQAHGEGGLSQALANAKRIDPPGGVITGLSDLPPLSERRVLRVGMEPFDRVVALELGAMSVFTGIPGSGKSTFLMWAAHRIAISEDIRVGVMAFETHPHEIRDQISLMRTRKPFRELSPEARASVLETADKRFRLVHRTFDDTSHRIGWLEDMVHTLAVRDGCKLIIVDPWNELEHLPEKNESMTSYINWALQRIRQLAEQYEVHIALVAHPKKLDGWRAPTGYDVADSAAFYNKPSLGVTVHQKDGEDGDRYVEISTWKVRNVRLYGLSRGKINVDFDPVEQQYKRREMS